MHASGLTMSGVDEFNEALPGAPPPSAGPTIDDLTLDDTLSDIQRIARYATSSIALQRLVHVRIMSETAKAEGYQATRDIVFPLLEALVKDEEPLVRTHLASQLHGVASVCTKQGSEDGYRSMCTIILPLLAKLLSDSQADVRIAAGESLVSVAGLVKREDLGARVLTIVLALAHDDEEEDLRMTAAVLLNELAETLGPELCHQFVTPEVICLAEDPVFRVRKAAAQNLDAICRSAGPTMALKRLVPAFLRLTQDEIWGVRKACAESLVSVSKCLEPSVRVSELIPVFERFTKDASKWVINAAVQHLGPFLATLPGPKITPVLLAHYARMGLTSDSLNNGHSTVNARMGTDPADAELAGYCAFSFPAVVMTLGKARWPELRALFVSLSRDVQRKVRRPLSYALHEMARMLGPEVADADLSPAFDLYLRDVEEVRQGAMRSLAAFLAALPPPSRDRYAPVLDELYRASQPHGWRFRRILAHQLPDLVPVFSPAAVLSAVVPLIKALLTDDVAAVREEVSSAIPVLLTRLGSIDSAAQTDFVQHLLFFSSARSYASRSLFARIAVNVANACPALFSRENFAERLYFLSRDKVRNVRLVIASSLAPLCPPLLIIERACTGAGAEGTLNGEDDDALPEWARADIKAALLSASQDANNVEMPSRPSLGIFHAALIALANDDDVEVLGTLPADWISAHRVKPVPIVADYIRAHSKGIEQVSGIGALAALEIAGHDDPIKIGPELLEAATLETES